MRESGVETTLGTYAMHSQPAFARWGYAANALPNSFRAQRQSLTLPVIKDMREVDVDKVVGALYSAIDRSQTWL